jgi:hypothetical protein
MGYDLDTMLKVKGGTMTLRMALEECVVKGIEEQGSPSKLPKRLRRQGTYRAKRSELRVDEDQAESDVSADGCFVYQYNKTNNIANLQNQITQEMYAKAKRMHKDFVMRRIKDEEIPLITRLHYRRADDKRYDEDEQPYLTKIHQCIKIIE